MTTPTDPARVPRFPGIRLRMTGRAPAEENRVSSPLELLFDLTFVVAIAQVASQLAQYIARGEAVAGVGPYLMVFFAIWWAWMNFTWFASAYDTDDVPYRLLTLVQMGGVLVLAAGVPSGFDAQKFTAITIGYVIMRIAQVSQWVRAAVEHPDGRTTALRYAVGISLVQVGWVARLTLPPEAGLWSFLVLAAADLSVPLWAERTGMTAWHPHHIAERYGLFTIIVLGESVAAATLGVQQGIDHSGLTVPLVTIAASSLILLFALWWLYFLEPAGAGLEAHRGLSFFWGYGHYFVFASLAALGAGLEVAVERGAGRIETPDAVVGYAVAIPVAVFLVMLWVLHAPLVDQLVIRPVAIVVATAAVLLLPLASPVIGLEGTVVGIAGVAAALTAVTIVDRSYRASRKLTTEES
ncbi:low temperature requirement protein A [Diaminobutyricibacter sp. McL0618]|uniref:low temperature requirement protein A n=1 Tax=Leifsonia sp. McL0618 TaxID=3415677 RepID=UPI003CF230CD